MERVLPIGNGNGIPFEALGKSGSETPRVSEFWLKQEW